MFLGIIFAESLIILVCKCFLLLPRLWFRMLRLGYVFLSKLGLHNRVRLFKEVVNAYSSRDVDADKTALLSVGAFKEVALCLILILIS